jgi:hypothetical protein
VRYSDYKCFRIRFDSGIAFVSIDHPPINLLDEVLSQEFDKLGRELEADETVRVVVLQGALPDYFIAHSGLSRVGNAPRIVSHTRSFRLTQTIGERFRNMPTGAFSSITEGLLVEAHESDLSVVSEVTQARVKEALKAGAETYDGELEMDYLSRLSSTR